jgi:hypothetical protein
MKIFMVLDSSGSPVKGFLSEGVSNKYMADHPSYHLDQVEVDESVDPKDGLGPPAAMKIMARFSASVSIDELRLSIDDDTDSLSDLDIANRLSFLENWCKKNLDVAFEPVSDFALLSWEVLDAQGKQINAGN